MLPPTPFTNLLFLFNTLCPVPSEREGGGNLLFSLFKPFSIACRPQFSLPDPYLTLADFVWSLLTNEIWLSFVGFDGKKNKRQTGLLLPRVVNLKISFKLARKDDDKRNVQSSRSSKSHRINTIFSLLMPYLLPSLSPSLLCLFSVEHTESKQSDGVQKSGYLFNFITVTNS